MSDASEKREFTRVNLPFPLRIYSSVGVIEAPRGLDVSARGMSVPCHGHLAIGATCTVEILLGSDVSISAQAIVRRADAHGFAVEFTQIDFESFERLRNLLRFQAEDPARIDREFAEHQGIARS